MSILFLDLVGFTALTAGLDPEVVRSLQDRYFSVARDVIERYGGTVEKYIGDAVMAVWGAPVAHEDDAERSIRAALDLVADVGVLRVSDDGPPLVARAAVMSGEAAVSLGAVGQALVSGDLVSAASRLQGAAPSGGVLVDEATRRAAGAAVEFEEAGELELRGLPTPVRAWRARQIVSMRRGARRSTQLEPPFVGRDAELRLVKELLHATASEHRARLVSVTGQAGIGKSRLAWELEKYVDGIVEDIWWHQGRSPAYGDGVTFWALAEMVRSRAGIAETEASDVARARLAAMLAEHLPDEAERARAAPAFGTLLGLEDTPPEDPERLFAAWRLLFERIARRGLVVLVFEDLQWADPGLIDFIESILTWSRSHPILVVTLARPELLDRHRTWGAGQRNFSALHLEPLGEDPMRALLAGLVPGLPGGLERQIIERAAGIPLFAVETVRMLLDEGHLVLDGDRARAASGLDRLAIPDTLRSLVTARLDALEPAERALLQAAAVLGQSFPVDALEAVTGEPAERLLPRLEGLVRRELLEELTDPSSPERGQYAFVQGVIREVAYDTLSRQDRRARHIDAARYFESVGSDDLAGILASHYHDAYLAARGGPEADALAAQARVALRAAAERAEVLGAYAQALTYLEKALAVTPEQAERAAAWERGSALAHRAVRFDVADEYGRRALDWYEQAGDDLGQARAAVLVSRPMGDLGQTKEALEVLEPVLARTPAGSAEPDIIALEVEVARHLMIARDPRALEAVDAPLARAEALELVPITLDALVTKAGALDNGGRTLESRALLRGAIDLAVAHGLTGVEFRARSNLANSLFDDDPRAAIALLSETIALARELGWSEALRWLTWVAVGCTLGLGHLDEAAALVRDLEEVDLVGSDQDSILGTQATIAAFRGDADLAARLRAAEEAVHSDVSRADFVAVRHSELAQIRALAGDLPGAFVEATAAANLVPLLFASEWAMRIAIWMQDRDRALGAWARVEASVTRGRYATAIRRSLEAGLAAIEGRHDDAKVGYRAAAAALRALDTPLALGLSLLDHATLVGPDDPEARAAAAEARGIFTELGMPPLLARLEAAEARWDAGRSRRVAAGEGIEAPSAR